MVDRRHGIRAVAKLEVHDRGASEQRVPLYITGNISAGGMFLITQTPFNIDTKFKISFELPDGESRIEAVGTVVWKRSDREASDRQPGMGIQAKPGHNITNLSDH